MMRLFLFFVIVSLAGCGGGSAPVAPPRKAGVSDSDKTELALETFRRGGDVAQYRDALILLGPGLLADENQKRYGVSPEQRKFLGELTVAPPEIQEIAAVQFRPIDAVHVEACSVFRDAARYVEVAGMDEVDQAAFAFDWVSRRVLLHEQRQTGMPPVYVLRAGFGGPADRGLVFLALAQQMKLDGCLFVSKDAPASDPQAPLVGVLIRKNLYLFDTRLGRPVPGPDGKGIATWNDVVKQPELLKASKLDPTRLEARVVASLESLSPRMKYLESLLQGEEDHIGGERLVVAVDPSALGKRLREAGASIGDTIVVWAPALRGLRQFTAPEDGGVDKAKRSLRFAYNLVPWNPVIQRYQELKILGEIPAPARETLLNVTAQLFEKYYRQPGEMLVRGKTEMLPRRLERIQSAIDETEFTQAASEIAPIAGRWRDRVNQAYLAAIKREPDGEAKVKKLWEEDQYLAYLLDPEVESIPRGAVKGDVSRFVLEASREPLGARANWLFASLSQDKAERADAVQAVRKAAGRENASSTTNSRNAWLNARGAWTKYLDRNNLGPSLFKSSLPELRQHLQRGDAERALTQWEYLHRELHHYVAAKLELAQALRQTGQNPDAMLADLAAELEALRKDESLAKERDAAPAAGIFNAPDGQVRWSLLMRDWGADGYIAWLEETVRLAKTG